ncbi:protoglobin domain-containing protein [Gulosibacter molinativorax]|uniref:Protogloblin ApPgb n=1 Tax=Gulosibacter molinativorax TaxID=256821 RepID=A0ABT7C769_9MICO|nr:protoglobin domain-containing protein [Gulosibacter molinativorax]MDJ1371029.1 protogloblin ApPgb [Gulosibacter molinativorax]QUY61389.1 Protogloblin ApPgb [Gulosibacter molinativorax]
MSETIPGYTYDSPDLAPSPVTLDDLRNLQTTLLWSDADTEALRRAGEILIPQTDAILDVWYGFVGSTPHLVATFVGEGGQPDGEYLDRVRARFGQWIADLTTRDFDEHWLAYQNEIARRHHPTGKNETDGVKSPSTHVPLRDLIGFVVPLTVTIRDFLAKGESDAGRLDALYHAWFKAVTLTAALWARPYAPDTW